MERENCKNRKNKKNTWLLKKWKDSNKNKKIGTKIKIVVKVKRDKSKKNDQINDSNVIWRLLFLLHWFL